MFVYIQIVAVHNIECNDRYISMALLPISCSAQAKGMSVYALFHKMHEINTQWGINVHPNFLTRTTQWI